MSTSPDDQSPYPRNVSWVCVHDTFMRDLYDWAQERGLVLAPVPVGFPVPTPEGKAHLLVPGEQLRTAMEDTRRYRIEYDEIGRPRIVDTELQLLAANLSLTGSLRIGDHTIYPGAHLTPSQVASQRAEVDRLADPLAGPGFASPPDFTGPPEPERTPDWLRRDWLRRTDSLATRHVGFPEIVTGEKMDDLPQFLLTVSTATHHGSSTSVCSLCNHQAIQHAYSDYVDSTGTEVAMLVRCQDPACGCFAVKDRSPLAPQRNEYVRRDTVDHRRGGGANVFTTVPVQEMRTLAHYRYMYLPGKGNVCSDCEHDVASHFVVAYRRDIDVEDVEEIVYCDQCTCHRRAP